MNNQKIKAKRTEFAKQAYEQFKEDFKLASLRLNQIPFFEGSVSEEDGQIAREQCPER